MIRFLAVLSCLFVGISSGPVLAESAAVDSQVSAQKINLAGRQRMLSQRMAKSACFVAIDVARENNLDATHASRALFDQTLQGLVHGNADLRLPKEASEDVVRHMGEVNTLWQLMEVSMIYVAEATVGSTNELGMLDTLSLMLLRDANAAVGALQNTYAGTGSNDTLSATVNIAGRQRMLSQKMAKEACMIGADVSASKNRRALRGTMELFETTLARLQSGDPEGGVMEPVSDMQAAQLARVETIWRELKPQLAKLLSGDDIAGDVLTEIAELNNPLLVEMNKAVGMYAAAN